MFRNPVTDLIIVVVVALLIFGPKRLPMLGRALGQGLREFKEGITGEGKGAEERPALTPTVASDSVPQPTAASPPEPAVVPGPAAPRGEADPRSTEAGSSEPRS